MDRLAGFLRREDGQDVVEYGLLISTVSVLVLLGTGAFGEAIRIWFTLLARSVTTP